MTLKFGIQMQFDIGTFNHQKDNSSKNYMTELIKKVLQIQYNGDLNNGEHLSNKHLLVRYSDVQYSNDSLVF